MVFPKHGPTFCPRLWSSTMLLRGGTRGSTVRGNVVINSTVPRWWDTAKRFRPASPAVALENHQYDRPMDLPPKPEILSEIHYRVPFRSSAMTKPKTASKLKPDDRFSAQESNASGRSCMHEANPCAQLCRFKMAPDYPGIHGLCTRHPEKPIAVRPKASRDQAPVLPTSAPQFTLVQSVWLESVTTVKKRQFNSPKRDLRVSSDTERGPQAAKHIKWNFYKARSQNGINFLW